MKIILHLQPIMLLIFSLLHCTTLEFLTFRTGNRMHTPQALCTTHRLHTSWWPLTHEGTYL